MVECFDVMGPGGPVARAWWSKWNVGERRCARPRGSYSLTDPSVMPAMKYFCRKM